MLDKWNVNQILPRSLFQPYNYQEYDFQVFILTCKTRLKGGTRGMDMKQALKLPGLKHAEVKI